MAIKFDTAMLDNILLIPIIFAAYVAIALLGLSLHEAGRLLGGRLVGFRFALLIVGPLQIERHGERLRWKLNTRPALYGGLAASMPTTFENVKQRFFWLVAAGPLTSLVAGALALVLYLFAASLPVNQFVTGGIFAFGAVSLGVGLVTLIPNRLSGMPSDGLRLIQLRRAGPEGERGAALMVLAAQAAGGAHPREWDDEMVRLALSVPDRSYEDLLAHFFAYLRALAFEDLERAERHLRYCLDHLEGAPAAFRPAVRIEAAYFEAAYLRNAAEAQRLLDSAGNSALVEKEARLRAAAAAFAVAGKTDLAHEKMEKLRARLKTERGIGSREFEREELARLERLLVDSRSPRVE